MLPRGWCWLSAPVLLVVAGGGLSACGAFGEPAPGGVAVRSTYDVYLDFEGAGAGTGTRKIGSIGRLDVEVSPVETGGGWLRLVKGQGGGTAAQLPSLVDVQGGARVVLTVRAPGTADALSPGGADFVFGAQIMVDEDSDGLDADNGNNIVQRGLFGDDAQYKLQIDKGRVSCRVVGAAGEAFVAEESTLAAGTWYSVTCERRANEVILSVATFGPDGREEPRRTSLVQDVGRVQMANPEMPLAIGGKIASDGSAVESDSDQFNGVVDNIFFDVVGR